MTRKFLTYVGILLFLPLLSFGQAKFEITHGPYLQALGDQQVDILWTTNRNAVSWVEIAPDDGTHFYLKERPKKFGSKHGFKTISTLHKVRVDQLEPGTTYRYRILSQEVLSHVGTDVQYGKITATAVYKTEPLSFTTSTPNQKELSFALVNDIHGRNEVFVNLLNQLDLEKTDLIFFNGDMADNYRSEDQLFGDFMDTAVEQFASEIPMYYARGNHETRGDFAHAFSDYFPTNSGDNYYLLRRGPVCFIVIDCGEDKPDTDIEYSGIAVFDEYRDRQAEWLKKAIKSPEYTSAPYKIVVNHMPPFGGWHGEMDINEKFVPILNEAKAQIMISGHFHRHVKKEAEPGGHQFPILVNSNAAIVKVTANQEKMDIKVVNEKGEIQDSVVLFPSK